MLIGAFRPTSELRAVTPSLLPQEPTLENFSNLFSKLDFATYFFNSALIAVTVTLANLLFCSMAGYALAKLQFAGRNKVFGARAGHADGARQRHARAAVRADEQARPGQHVRRGDPAVRGRSVRRVPDAPVHRRPAGRVAGRRPRRRRERVADLLADRPAAVQAGARGAGDLPVPRVLEQLPVAARGPDRREQVHAAGRARDVRDRPEQGGLRPVDGRRRRPRGPGDPGVPAAPAALHPEHRHDRPQGLSEGDPMTRILILRPRGRLALAAPRRPRATATCSATPPTPGARSSR